MARAILFFALVLFCLVFGYLFLPFHFIYCIGKALKRREYPLQAFIGYDQAFNAILAPFLNRLFKDPMVSFGNPDRTISGTIGQNLRDFPEKTHRSMKIIDRWLTAIDPNSDKSHCIDSIENDEI